MKTPLIEKLTEYRAESGLSYDKLEQKTGISSSTICRWYKGQGVPSLDEIELLCDAMGHDIADVFVTVGKQEMVATQSIGYQGADAMAEHYEARLAAAKEKYDLLQNHHDQRIKEINENHGKSVEYLKDEIKRLRQERDDARKEAADMEVDYLHKIADANKAASDVTGKKHIVFWVLVGIDVLMAILLLIALFTGPIV